jgi:glutathione synthase/RimK-type ligase-like ATP-grasp enzyme
MLGILTYENYPKLTEDDQLFARHLDERKISYTIIDWNQGLSHYDITHLLIRSPWDYYLKPQKFLNFLDECENKGVTVINSAHIVRWNHTKHYLDDLKKKNLAIVDSLFFKPDQSPESIKQILEQKKWNHLVIKPAISGSSYLTFQTSLDNPELESQITQILKHGDLLAQPYLPSIRECGEVSMIYFCDQKPEYSHSAHKKPKAKDFRVQVEFGGSTVYFDPDENLKQLGEKILSALPAGWVYVRIDLVDWQKNPLISEIEMIEPALYFSQHPSAAKKFSDLLIKKYSL